MDTIKRLWNVKTKHQQVKLMKIRCTRSKWFGISDYLILKLIKLGQSKKYEFKWIYEFCSGIDISHCHALISTKQGTELLAEVKSISQVTRASDNSALPSPALFVSTAPHSMNTSCRVSVSTSISMEQVSEIIWAPEDDINPHWVEICVSTTLVSIANPEIQQTNWFA